MVKLRQLAFHCIHCGYANIYTYNEMMKKPPYCEKCGHQMVRTDGNTVNSEVAAHG
jgi:uncharacterized protein (DUF983 family)